MDGGKYSESKPLTDLESAEMNERYESIKSEIESLKVRICKLRKSSKRNMVQIAYKEHTESVGKDEESKDEKKRMYPSKCKLSEKKKLSGHGNKVYGADWNPLLNEIVSVGRDGKLIFWNAETGYKRLAYPLDTEFIMTLRYSPNAEYVACGGLDDILSIFPVKREETGICKDIEPSIYKGHTGYISCLEYIDNHRILTASGDATIREWDVEYSENRNTPKTTLKMHREDVMSIHLNPNNNNLLLTGSVDSTTKILDLRTEEKDALNVTHSFYMGYDQGAKCNRTTDVNVVKWYPNGICFVAGCDDGTVRLFDIRSGGILNEYSYHRNYRLSDAPNKATTNTANHNFKSSQPQNNKLNDQHDLIRTSTNTPIKNHDFTPNQTQLNHDEFHSNKASDLDDTEYAMPFEDDYNDPTDGVATLDFSKSGCFMFVSYNNDKHKVLAWNVLTGDVVDELKHDGHVPSLSISPDGTKLVTACWDHHLKLWA